MYKRQYLRGNGASASSSRSSSQSYISPGFIDAATATSNTFASYEIYIPSYLVSQNKPIANFGAQEDNATTAYVYTTSSLWQNTAAINSILIYNGNGSFVSGSSFWLYGIKNT